MQPAQKVPFSYSLCYWLAREWTGLGVVCTSVLLFFTWEDGKEGACEGVKLFFKGEAIATQRISVHE